MSDMTERRMWMVRAAKGGVLADDFREKRVVAIGWERLGNMSAVTDRDEVLRRVRELWPENSTNQSLASGSQFFRFLRDLRVGDRVASYDPNRRVYLVGTIEGEYAYDQQQIEGYPHLRSVRWDGDVDRDRLSVSTRNSLGAISTLFRIPNHAASEIERMLQGEEPEPGTEVEEPEDMLRDLQARSHEFIKDEISKLGWGEMQDLVAGVLRAMGYKTQVSSPGSDRGKDIIASPDGFGFEQPRIVVEVRHRTGQAMGAGDIRGFLGGRHKDDKGLYVSTGGFTKDARYEAERASIPIMLMDADDLVSAVVEHYEKMDPEARNLLPLTKVYWPA